MNSSNNKQYKVKILKIYKKLKNLPQLQNNHKKIINNRIFKVYLQEVFNK